VGGVGVGARHRGVVDGIHADRHGGGGAVEGAVVDLVGESVGAVGVGVGDVGERAVVVERETPLARTRHQVCRELVAVHVGVVGQNAPVGADGERRVLVGRVGIVARHRGVVDGADGDV